MVRRQKKPGFTKVGQYDPTWTVPSENSFYVSCLERPSRVFALHPRPPVGGRATKVWERRRRNNGRSRAGTHAPCRPNGGGVGCRGDRAGISVFSVAESRGRLSVGGLLGVLHVRPVKRKLFQALGTKCFHHRPPASWTEGQPASLGKARKCSANNPLGRRKPLKFRNFLAATVQVGSSAFARTCSSS
jgi:hypothetical protein